MTCPSAPFNLMVLLKVFGSLTFSLKNPGFATLGIGNSVAAGYPIIFGQHRDIRRQGQSAFARFCCSQKIEDPVTGPLVDYSTLGDSTGIERSFTVRTHGIGHVASGILSAMIRQIAPQFFTTDIPGTLAYYKDKLGFDCLSTWQDPPEYANRRA
jgi:hypothetical protein